MNMLICEIKLKRVVSARTDAAHMDEFLAHLAAGGYAVALFPRGSWIARKDDVRWAFVLHI